MPLTSEQKTYLIFKQLTGFSDEDIFGEDEESPGSYTFSHKLLPFAIILNICLLSSVWMYV